MKKLLILVSLFALTLNFAKAQSEAAAIQKMIEAESFAFHNNADRYAFMSYWNIIEGAHLVYSGNGTCLLLKAADMKTAAEKGEIPKADHAKTEMTNYVIRNNGNVAWASFDQKSTISDGKVSNQHEFRCLEKIGGEWKIISSSVHGY